MTESEWQECQDTEKLLEYLSDRTSERKYRLFACACCRSIWNLLRDERGKSTLTVAERYADDWATADEVESAKREIAASRSEPVPSDGLHHSGLRWADDLTEHVLFDVQLGKSNPADLGAYTCDWTAARAGLLNGEAGRDTEIRLQLLLLHDIFENPYRPSWVEPEWLTPTVIGLAQAAYDERIMPSGELGPDRLAVLSDALEEAGCDDSDILNHLRSPGPHIRGCWAVDLILGKE